MICRGGFYGYPGHLASKFYSVAMKTPFYHIEDVFVSTFLVPQLRIKDFRYIDIGHVWRFIFSKAYDPARPQTSDVRIIFGVDPNNALKYWSLFFTSVTNQTDVETKPRLAVNKGKSVNGAVSKGTKLAVNKGKSVNGAVSKGTKLAVNKGKSVNGALSKGTRQTVNKGKSVNGAVSKETRQTVNKRKSVNGAVSKGKRLAVNNRKNI